MVHLHLFFIFTNATAYALTTSTYTETILVGAASDSPRSRKYGNKFISVRCKEHVRSTDACVFSTLTETKNIQLYSPLHLYSKLEKVTLS